MTESMPQLQNKVGKGAERILLYSHGGLSHEFRQEQGSRVAPPEAGTPGAPESLHLSLTCLSSFKWQGAPPTEHMRFDKSPPLSFADVTSKIAAYCYASVQPAAWA